MEFRHKFLSLERYFIFLLNRIVSQGLRSVDSMFIVIAGLDCLAEPVFRNPEHGLAANVVGVSSIYLSGRCQHLRRQRQV